MYSYFGGNLAIIIQIFIDIAMDLSPVYVVYNTANSCSNLEFIRIIIVLFASRIPLLINDSLGMLDFKGITGCVFWTMDD